MWRIRAEAPRQLAERVPGMRGGRPAAQGTAHTSMHRTQERAVWRSAAGTQVPGCTPWVAQNARLGKCIQVFAWSRVSKTVFRVSSFPHVLFPRKALRGRVQCTVSYDPTGPHSTPAQATAVCTSLLAAAASLPTLPTRLQNLPLILVDASTKTNSLPTGENAPNLAPTDPNSLI